MSSWRQLGMVLEKHLWRHCQCVRGTPKEREDPRKDWSQWLIIKNILFFKLKEAVFYLNTAFEKGGSWDIIFAINVTYRAV